MKKGLKIFIIILLVILAAVGTAVIFYKNLNKDKPKNISISTLTQVVDSAETKQKVNSVDLLYKEKVSTSTIIEEYLTTNEKLDSCVNFLCNYIIAETDNISDEEIYFRTNSVLAKQSKINRMMNEYILKATKSSYFDREIGLTDLYNAFTTYIVEKSTLVKDLNNFIDVNKNVDITFSMLDLYSSVALNTYSNLINGKIVSNESLNLMNSKFEIKNNQLSGLVVEQSSIEVNKFIEAYYKCDKLDLAKNLNSYMSTTPSNELTKKAVDSFKLVYGI